MIQKPPGKPSAYRDLVRQQRELAEQVIVQDQFAMPVQLVAGVDVAFPDRGRTTRAAAVLMTLPALTPVAESIFECPTTMPYIPGLLSFREAPAMAEALGRLPQTPDVVLCDGQGLAHPRRFGVACHLGVKTGLVTIGVGKSRLCGSHGEPGRTRGSQADLEDHGEVIGKVLRSRNDVRPLFISSGHRISLDSAVDLVLQCLGRFRLPEPIRRADLLAGHRPDSAT